MILVPQDAFQSRAGTYDVHKVNIRQELAQLLANRNLPDDIVQDLYNTAIQRYNKLKEQEQQPIKLPIVSEPAEDAAPATQPTSTEVENQYQRALSSVPKGSKAKARLLIEEIKGNANLQVDKRGQVVHRGQTLEGSNITDLVNELVRNRKRALTPIGVTEVLKALGDENVARESIGNEKWLNTLYPGIPAGREEDITPFNSPQTYDEDEDDASVAKTPKSRRSKRKRETLL